MRRRERGLKRVQLLFAKPAIHQEKPRLGGQYVPLMCLAIYPAAPARVLQQTDTH
jgi:hypothetical protein